ncbi:MAG TPA: DUF748 domain-containing protein [Opitutaceae bacterium]|jgi:hypothetical protein|nr:DUF748 domain-containing protein [Opitutaceae bacterium]
MGGYATDQIVRDTWLSRFSRRTLKIAVVLIVILLVLRLCAAFVVKYEINKRLAHIPDYSGHVDGVSLHLWRGAYSMSGLAIRKSNGKVSEPFFSADRIDFSIAWRELFKGRFVSAIYARNVQLIFVQAASTADSQLTADSRWQDVVNDLFPIDITFLDIRGGVLRYVDKTASPIVDVSIKELNISATGLQNRATPKDGEMPARIQISGVSLGDGNLKLFAKLEPLAIQPHFQLAMEMKKVSLPALNDMLSAYVKVKVSEGQFDVVAQMAMANGHYEGYVKPFLTSVKFADVDPAHDTIGRRIWKALVSAFADLAKNKDSQQIATRIPFAGDSKNLDVGMWKTIKNGLHHGFIKALPRGFEGTTNPDGLDSKKQAETATPKGPVPEEPRK